MMNEREFLSDFFEWISFRMLKWYNLKTRWNLILTQNIFMFRRCTLVYAVIFHAALDIHRIRSYNSWHISIFCSLEKFKVSKTILILSFISIEWIFLSMMKIVLLYLNMIIMIFRRFMDYKWLSLLLLQPLYYHQT